jgi:hypothetical protein
MSTIYLIRDTETEVQRLVRANNKAAALRFVMKPLTIAAATPEQLVALLTGAEPVKVEDAEDDDTADDAPAPALKAA